MQFQITQIKFDLDDVDLISNPNLQEQLQEEYVGQIWESEDEEDLVEEITCASGWYIETIDYLHVLK